MTFSGLGGDASGFDSALRALRGLASACPAIVSDPATAAPNMKSRRGKLFLCAMLGFPHN
ncbi:hypothetical protein LMG27198_40610 [Methylocystis echinoides]|uniref:Uncharacterized protein n=1 Tax=Methylocystis echinoides TaxID=29468 RepID=A0A9W6GY00_9HYPH|nr:hypothetical protein LMG27198_40610 [Methylocystis echinoides]